jgi:polyisoprenoid-binding protein YceI
MMKKKQLLPYLLLFIFITIPFFVQAQKLTLDNETSFLQVLGTSSLHDWHIQAEKQSGNLVLSDADKLAISSLTFSVESESLKSGKSAMDKKTFEALNTKKFKTIEFILTEVLSVHKKTEKRNDVSATGNLIINGVKKSITLKFSIEKNEKVYIFEGSHKLLMTTFGIAPPKALFGTIKTGDEIEVKFKSIFKN